MIAKKPLPIWSIAAVLAVVLGGIAFGVTAVNNSGIDKDALIRRRTRPGTAAAPASASPDSYGRARGTPIIPVTGGSVSDPRRKPMR